MIAGVPEWKRLGGDIGSAEVCEGLGVGFSGRIGFGRLLTEPLNEQLEEVVTQAHEGPLGVDSMDTAQRELPESPSVFDLTVDGLHHGLAPGVPLPTLGGVETPAHALLRVECSRRGAGAGGRLPLSMTHPLGGDPGLGAQGSGSGFDLGVPVPGIAGCMLRRNPEVGLDPLKHGHEVPCVCGLVGDPTGDDDLMVLVHGKLGVVGLNESIPALHDRTVRVGEIALRLGDGTALGGGSGGLSRQFSLPAASARGAGAARVEFSGLCATLLRMSARATPYLRVWMRLRSAFMPLCLLAQPARRAFNASASNAAFASRMRSRRLSRRRSSAGNSSPRASAPC